ncbi:MAG: hypothetical protein IT314_02760 [Anaerolineales bacterium]|nr:hypothetical protein [Anaerolineales bacterium]
MRNKRLGCLSGSGIITAIVTILVIAGYVYARGGLLYNPGPLNAQRGEALGGVTSHAETGGNCEACHTAPWERATMADRCMDCHSGIAAQMQDTASLHGKALRNSPDLACRSCHPEHRGADAPLTEMDEASFPHEALGFSLQAHQLTSVNQPFACSDCHRQDIYTFAADACKNCHNEIESAFTVAHSAEYGDACLGCHDGVDRFDKNFSHPAGFALTEGHANLPCAQCHTGARTFVDFQNAPSTCYACHAEPAYHAGQFGTECEACHDTTAWSPAKFNEQHTFPLDHGDGASCATCHPSTFSNYTCYGCHEHNEVEIRSKHLEEGVSDFQNCMECHATGQKDKDGGDDDDDH